MRRNEDLKLIVEIYDAFEKLREWKPLYLAVLKATGDKKQASAAVKFIVGIQEEIEKDAA